MTICHRFHCNDNISINTNLKHDFHFPARNLVVVRYKPNASGNATVNSTVKIPVKVVAGTEYILRIAGVMNEVSALYNPG